MSDETIRLVIGEIDGGGSISYGPAKMGYKGHSYEIVVDYMKFQTYPKLFRYSVLGEKKIKIYTLIDSLPKQLDVRPGISPLYVGIGLRLKANITVNEGSMT